MANILHRPIVSGEGDRLQHILDVNNVEYEIKNDTSYFADLEVNGKHLSPNELNFFLMSHR